MELVEIIRVGNSLGEGVLWDEHAQALWWTDIAERKLYRYDWNSRRIEQFTTPERLCSFGFVRGADRLIAAFESGFALYDPKAGDIAWLSRLNEPGLRLNDGKVDVMGRFWAGSTAETGAARGKASLYCVDGFGRVACREQGITISNGIAFSTDGTRLYFADSAVRTIWQYALDPQAGQISNRQFFAETPPGAEPDGAAVDTEGFVWSAQWGASRIVRYAPNGRIDAILETPVRLPTCVTFGGPGLDHLIVTTARLGLDSEVLDGEPDAGDVLVYSTESFGQPANRYLLGRDEWGQR